MHIKQENIITNEILVHNKKKLTDKYSDLEYFPTVITY